MVQNWEKLVTDERTGVWTNKQMDGWTDSQTRVISKDPVRITSSIKNKD